MKVPRTPLTAAGPARLLQGPLLQGPRLRSGLPPAPGLASARPSCRTLSSARPSPGAETRARRAPLPPPGQAGYPRRGLSTEAPQPSPAAAVEGEAPAFAFAFDIDGVLLHVAEPIPGAAEALRYLQAHHVPFILLTNGGGRLEAERVADLSARLGVPLTTDNFVQSHTPFRQLAADGGGGIGGAGGGASLADATVLVTGSDASRARAVAESYGFRSVVTPADIVAAQPAVWPFDPLLREAHAAAARPLPAPVYAPGGPRRPEDCLRVAAAFVLNDPRDWALDIQLITDLLLSRGGVLGTYSPRNGDAALPNHGWQRDGQPALYFSNADLLWSTGYHLPRLGQGAFQAAVAGVWRRVTAGQAELEATSIGKPYGETYRFAERVLEAHRRAVLARSGVAGAAGAGRLRSVYMVGDNPESDVAGANMYRSAAGTEWTSVLVRTGVWAPGRGGELRHKPKVIVDDVKAAVRWALEREGWKGDL